MRNSGVRRLATLCFVVVVGALVGCGSNTTTSTGDGSSVNGQSSGVGLPCGTPDDAGLSQTAFATSSADCPSRICINLSFRLGTTDVTSGPLCTAACEQDSDCNGALADPNDPSDTRCKAGFICTILFVKGILCCKRLCVCTDFIGTNYDRATPVACQDDAAATCN